VSNNCFDVVDGNLVEQLLNLGLLRGSARIYRERKILSYDPTEKYMGRLTCKALGSLCVSQNLVLLGAEDSRLDGIVCRCHIKLCEEM